MDRAALARRLKPTRRALLVGAGAGGALVAAFALVPRHYAPPLVAGPGEQVVDSFLKLARDGTVTVAVPACEMGQGVTTLFAQIVAVELGADWGRIAVEPAPLSPAYADPVLAAAWAPLWLPAWLPVLPDVLGDPGNGLTRLKAERGPVVATVGGTALAAFETPLRQAAAGLRALLVEAAAAQWGVAADTLDTRDHAVTDGKRRLPFEKLVAAALGGTPPADPPLRPHPAAEPPARAPLSRPTSPRPAHPRLDLPAKVDGSFVFAADVRLPGMVHAAIAHGPHGDCVLSNWDAAAATRVPGCLGLVHAKGWLAAIGRTWHAADRAVAAMEPRFRARGPVAEDTAIEGALDRALREGRAHRLWAEGDPDALLAQPTLTARYDIEPALHAPLEPASCTARLEHGRLELWLATQAPEAARREGARAAGLSEGAVVVYPLQAGGSFDARLDARIAGEAAALARATGKPVQLTWSRWQESLAALPRAPFAARMDAAMSPDKQQMLGWRSRIATPASLRETAARLLDGEGVASARARWQDSVDPLALAGAMPAYAIPECAVEHVPVTLPLATQRMRGGPDAVTAFLTESFVDECAHHGGNEPLSFRIAMLGHAPRLVACLQGVARMAMWGGGADASGQGIACHRLTLRTADGLREGHIAVVATARQAGGAIRVDQLSACVDIGRIVNLDLARQQIEGGLVFGLGLAIGGSTGYAGGRPTAGRLGQLGLPLLADCPKVDVAFLDSSAEPFDPGDLGVVAVAPAIANALFSATGLRLRRLPLLSEGL